MRKDMKPASQATGTLTSLYYSVSGFDPRVNQPFGLSKTASDPNNVARATQAQFTTDLSPTATSPAVSPQNKISAVFISNTLLVCCEWGPL